MIIKAEDLRVGNFVNTPNAKQNPFRVDYFDKNKVYQENGTYDLGEIKDIPFHPLTWDIQDISPIPLTEEKLIMFGFEEEVNSQFVKFWRKSGITIFHRYDISPNEFKLSEFDLKIKHLHQLQNIYYALTNTELQKKYIMSNKKQTAVEWLISKLTEKPIEDINDEYWFGIIGKAKELEKQQHEETWYDSTLQFDNAAQMTNKKLFEDYYTETYGEQA